MSHLQHEPEPPASTIIVSHRTRILVCDDTMLAVVAQLAFLGLTMMDSTTMQEVYGDDNRGLED